MDEDDHKVILRFRNASDAIEAFDLVERLIPRGLMERGFLSMTPDLDPDPELAAAERAVIDTAVERHLAGDPRRIFPKKFADICFAHVDAVRALLRLRGAQASQGSGE